MLFVFHHPLKMEPIRSSETSDLNIHTPEKYPEELSTFIQHGESLKTRYASVLLNSFLLCLDSPSEPTPPRFGCATTTHRHIRVPALKVSYGRVIGLSKR